MSSTCTRTTSYLGQVAEQRPVVLDTALAHQEHQGIRVGGSPATPQAAALSIGNERIVGEGNCGSKLEADDITPVQFQAHQPSEFDLAVFRVAKVVGL